MLIASQLLQLTPLIVTPLNAIILVTVTGNLEPNQGKAIQLSSIYTYFAYSHNLSSNIW